MHDGGQQSVRGLDPYSVYGSGMVSTWEVLELMRALEAQTRIFLGEGTGGWSFRARSVRSDENRRNNGTPIR
eukprot:6693915-Pyramimonas_sp.AAC.1